MIKYFQFFGGIMLVYGKNVINEILNNNTKIYKVFLDNNFNIS